MALFNLLARLSLDNSQFNAGLQSSVGAAEKAGERIGHHVTRFFTRGFLALAGLHSLKTFINETDRMADSWFEMNEQLQRFGKGMDLEVLRKLVEARVRMEQLKINTLPARAEAQGLLGKGATAVGSGLQFAVANDWLFAAIQLLKGKSAKETLDLREQLMKSARFPYTKEGEAEIQAKVDAEMERLRTKFEDKHKPEEKVAKEMHRKFFEVSDKRDDPLAKIGGFSQFDTMPRKADEQLNELKKISKNTTGLDFNL